MIKKLINKITRSTFFNLKDNENNISNKAIIGRDCSIVDTIIQNNVIIGNNCRIKSSLIRGTVQVGNFTSIWGPGIAILQKINPISIGNFCSIARDVSIQEYNHNSKKISTYYIGSNIFKEQWENENVSKGPIVIGNDVWIGAGCRILSGSNIGHGCVVAANSVVNNTFPPFSIIGGIPAKIIGYRFDEELRNRLIELSWWDWDLDKIKENKFLFIDEITLELLNQYQAD